MTGPAGSTSGATCNEEQIEACRDAASTGRMDTLRSGGECISKRYMEFSHMCTVVDYLPTVDYCCCSHQHSLVLCCRYHQDWNHFRCNEADDVVLSGAELNGTFNSQSSKLTSLPPLTVLVPSVLVPLFVVICCLIGCIRCYRQQHSNNSSPQYTSTQHRHHISSNGSLQQTNNYKRSTGGNGTVSTGVCDSIIEGLDDGTTTPLTSSSPPSNDVSSRLSRDDGYSWSAARCRSSVVEPSAPPAPPDDCDTDYVTYHCSAATHTPANYYGVANFPLANRFSVANNCQHCSLRQPPITVCTSGGPRHVVHHAYFRSNPTPEVVNGYCSGGSRCSSCGQQVAPPPYEEHWRPTT